MVFFLANLKSGAVDYALIFTGTFNSKFADGFTHAEEANIRQGIINKGDFIHV